MAVLAFRVEADYQEAIQCRAQLDQLEKSMNDLIAAGKQQSQEFDNLSDQYYQVSKRLSDLSSKAAEAAYYLGPEFKKKISDSAQEVSKLASELVDAREKLNSMIGSGKYNAQDIANQRNLVNDLARKYVDASEKNKQLTDLANARWGEMGDSIEDVTKKVNLFGSSIGSGSPLDQALGIFSGKLKAAFSIAGLSAFLKQVYSIRSYFQDIESSMEVFLGSQQEAAQFTKDLQHYAYYNMFEFADLANASKQLIAYGNEVNKISGKGGILDQLSNIATATKVPLMELVNAWNKAKSTGRVDGRDLQSWAGKGLVLKDVLKQMGEEVKGNTISFEQLKKAIAHVTEEGQMFGGLMDKMMPNLSSSMGQLQDNLKLMWNDIGKQLQDPIHDAIDFASKLVSNYEKIGKAIADVAVVYGAAKAALVVYNAVEAITNAQKAIEIINNTALVKSENKLTLARYAAIKAQKALNGSMLTNPYVALAAAIAGVGIAMYKEVQANDNSVMSQKKLNKYIIQAHEGYETEKEDLDDIFAKLRQAKDNRTEYNETVSDAVKLFGKYNSGLEAELQNVDNLDSAYQSLAQSIKDANDQRTYEKARQDIMDTYNSKVESKQEDALNILIEKFGEQKGREKFYELMNDIQSGKLTLSDNPNYGKATTENPYRPGILPSLFKSSKLHGEPQYLINDENYYNFASSLQEAYDSATKEWEEFHSGGWAQTGFLTIDTLPRTKEDWDREMNAHVKNMKPRFDTEENMRDLYDVVSDWIEIETSKREALDSTKGAILGVNAVTASIEEDIAELLKGLSTEEQLAKIKELENTVNDLQKEADKNPGKIYYPLVISLDPQVEETPRMLNEKQIRAVARFLQNKDTRLSAQLKKDDNDKDKRMTAAYNYRRTSERNKQSLDRQLVDSFFGIRQTEINAIKESSDKELQTVMLNFSRTAEDIRRKRQDFVKKLNDDARAEWQAANPDKKPYEFADPYKLVDDQIVASNSVRNKERTKQAFQFIADLKTQEKMALDAYTDSLNDFFKKYATGNAERDRILKENITHLSRLVKEYNDLQRRIKEGDKTIDMDQVSYLEGRINEKRNTIASTLGKLSDENRMNDYLIEFGNYYERRKATEEKYDRIIATIPDTFAETEVKKVIAELDAVAERQDKHVRRIGREMNGLFGGNVDLANRKRVPNSELIKAGYDEEEGGYATVFSSGYQVFDKNGEKHEILVTPILPDGTVLSKEEVDDYISNIIDGADDLLKADEKGIIISVDFQQTDMALDMLQKLGVDVTKIKDFDIGNLLHLIQEAYDKLNDKHDETVQEIETKNAELNKIVNPDKKRAENQKKEALKEIDLDPGRYSSILNMAKDVASKREKIDRDYDASKRKLDDDRKNLEIRNAQINLELSRDVSEERKKELQDEQNALNKQLQQNARAFNVLKSTYADAIADLEIEEGGGLAIVFGDVAKYTKNQLMQAKKIALEYRKNHPELSEEKIEALQHAINDIDNAEFNKQFEMGEASLENMVKEFIYLKNLQEQLSDARRRDDEATAEALEMQIEQIKEKLGKDAIATGVNALVSGLQKAAELMKKLGSETENYKLEQVGSALGDLAQNLSAAEKGAEAWGGWWGAIIGGVTDILGQLYEAWVENEIAVYKYEKAIESATEAVHNLQVQELLSKDGGIFGDNWEGEIENINQALDAIKDYREELNQQYSEEGVMARMPSFGEAVNDNVPIAKRVSSGDPTKQTLRTKYVEGFMGIGRQEEDKTVAEVASELGLELYDEYGNLNAKSLKAIKDTYSDLTDAEKEWIDQAIEDSENYAAGMEKLKGILSNIFNDTASRLADATLDGITRGATLGADQMKSIMSGTAKDLQKMLVQSIYSKYLETYADEALKIVGPESTSTNKEKDLLDLYAKMFDNMQVTIDAATQAGLNFQEYAREKGFDIAELENADVGAKAYQTLSETTGNAIDGRLTSLQISSANRDYMLTLIGGNISEMMAMQARDITIAQDIHEILTDTYLCLQKIKDNTDSNVVLVGAIEDKVNKIYDKL